MICLCHDIVAKQEAFEEKSRLKNQFRSLDEDEVDFLDSVLESTRAREAAVKKDTADQLESFRRHREEAEKALLEQAASDVKPAQIQAWTAPALKRRRDKQKDLLVPGKKRKSSVSENAPEKGILNKQDQAQHRDGNSGTKAPKQELSSPNQATPVASATTAGPDTQSKAATDIANGPKTKPVTTPSVSLGLGGYSSDSE